jgi:predicted dehydrogenase
VLASSLQRGHKARLTSCFSRDAVKREAFRKDFCIERSASSFEELLADPEIEGLVVATPNDSHRELIVAALEAGKGVYTEKPIAGTMEDAIAIADTVASTGQAFAVGHNTRRLAVCRTMRRWIDDGRLGTVSIAEVNYSNARGLKLTADSWRASAKGPRGPMVQLGIHHADNLNYLLGRARSVSAHSRRLCTQADIPDTAMALVEYESGALATIGTAWVSAPVFSINLQGTRANLRFTRDSSHENHGPAGAGGTLWAEEHGDSESQPRRTSVALGSTDMFLEQIEEFALALRGEATIEVGPTQAVEALAVVHAALLSSKRSGTPVPIDEVLEGAAA